MVEATPLPFRCASFRRGVSTSTAWSLSASASNSKVRPPLRSGMRSSGFPLARSRESVETAWLCHASTCT